MNWKSKTALLVILTVLSTGCDRNSGKYCPMPVRAPDSVKTWIKNAAKMLPPPAEVKPYFKDVGDQQQAIEDNCGAILWLP